MVLGVFFGGVVEDRALRVLEVVNVRAVGSGSDCLLIRVLVGRVLRGRMGMHGVLETEERKGRRIRAIAAIVGL